MTKNSRSLLGMMIILTVFVAGALWAYSEMIDARDRRVAAEKQLMAAIKLEADIVGLRQRPAQISDRQLAEVELLTELETAARRAGLPTRQLDRIQPENPRRVGESVFMAYPTRITIRQSTLLQTLNLLDGFLERMPGFVVAGIRMSAPRGMDTGDSWRVELLLEHLVYQPPETTR